MKRCSTCQQWLEEAEFYRNAAQKDGLGNACKACVREHQRKYRAAHPDKTRELARESKRRERERKGPEIVAAEWREWYERNAEHRRKYKRERQDPVKVAAQNKLDRAVRAGRIIRPSRCSQCGRECRPDAHHADYSQPLAVTWLCRSCHVGLQA